MPKALANTALHWLLVTAAVGLHACTGGSDVDGDGADAHGETDASDVDSGATSVAFDQPLGGLLVALPLPELFDEALFVLRGSSTVETLPLATGAIATPGLTAPEITAVNREAVAPFETLVLTVSGLHAEPSALTVLFRPEGGKLTGVPVVVLDGDTIEVTVPAIFGPDGEPTAAMADLQLVQVGTWGRVQSNRFFGVAIEALPAIPTDVEPAGTLFDAYLGASLTLLQTSLDEGDPSLPPAYRDSLLQLSGDLDALRTAVAGVRADPTAVVPLELMDFAAGSAVLDAETLANADRIVAGMLQASADAFGPVGDSKHRTATRTQALSDCEPPGDDPVINEMRELLCERQRYGEALVMQGSRGIQLGVQIETSIFLGFYGGVAGSLYTGSQEVAVAGELAWAALSGYLSSWASSSPQPTAGETLGDMGATLVDRLAGTNPILATTVSAIRFGQAYDAIIQDAREAVIHPETGADSDATTPDSGYDGGAGNALDGNYEGTFAQSWVETNEDCEARLTLTLYVTLGGGGGSGTDDDPYTGQVDAFGSVEAVGISGPARCFNLQPTAIPPTETSVEGANGTVTFSFSGNVGFTLNYAFSGTVESSTTISGDFSILTRSGPLELTRQ